MPKILARDPAWLSRPTVGHKLFQPDADSKVRHSAVVRSDGPLRKIAHRSTEIFVVVGNEIRWSELGLLRDLGEVDDRKRGIRNDGVKDAEELKAYRVLKIPVARPIQHISVSPSGDYMAVLTSHTCHVCILPAATHLRVQEAMPLRLKTFQIGPTAHVLEQSPLASALWHPLSPSGDALVTVTHDACVRLWELDSENRSSFNEPALAIDLKKLANATSSQADFSTSKYGTNRGFSPDEIEMQVAAACFGGQGTEDEHGWASMTLWIAMTEGDVYALCPFLPSSWRAPATLLPSLSTSVVERSKALAPEAEDSEKRVVDQQTRWLADVDAQEPLLMTGRDEFETFDVYARPKQLSAVPKLQGPFAISPEPDLGELTDIYVIAPKLDDDALYDENYEAPGADEGLSVSIICLATSTNEVHVCLDVDGVEAEWLPSKRSRAYIVPDHDDWKELVLFETIDLAQSDDDDNGWPTFTLSPNDRYELFVTHSKSVCSLSFKPWVSMLEAELAAPSDSGAGFRLNVVLDSARTAVDEIIDLATDSDAGVSTALAILEPTFGYLLLTTTPNGPFAAILDIPNYAHPYLPDSPTIAGALPAPEPRAPYRPAPELDQPSALPRLIKAAHDKKLLGTNNDPKGQIHFSPATLQLLTEAHRIMSSETYRLGMAAADLFRRCERMRLELQEQIRKVAEIAQRVDAVTGQDEEDAELADEDGEAPLTGKEKLDHRIEISREKTAELNERADRLRRKMLRLGGPGGKLSAKEVLFIEEVGKVEQNVLSPPPKDNDAENPPATSPAKPKTNSLASRFDALQALQRKLVEQAEEAASQQQEVQKKEGSGADATISSRSSDARFAGGAIGADFRKQKLAQVMALLERETALIEAVMERFKRLQQGV